MWPEFNVDVNDMSSFQTKFIELNKKYYWLTPLAIFLLWRLSLELIGRIILTTASPIPQPWPADPWPPLWARWDSGWYSNILSYGYQLHAGLMSNVTFFPLFPLLWKGAWWLTHVSRLAAGVLTANIIAAGACVAFWLWIKTEYNSSRATLSLIALLAFPSSLFLIAAYSESTLFFCITLSLWASQNKRWGWSAVAAAFASAARPVGILLWPVLLWRWYKRTNHETRTTKQFALLTLLPLLGLILFSLYLWYHVGDPLAWLHAQTYAGRGLASPLTLLSAYVHNIVTLDVFWGRHLAELAALVFIIVLLPAIKRLGTEHLLLVVLNLLPPLFSNTLTSLPRFLIVVPSIFLAISSKKPHWFITYLIISIPLLVLSISQFVTWQWAG